MCNYTFSYVQSSCGNRYCLLVIQVNIAVCISLLSIGYTGKYSGVQPPVLSVHAHAGYKWKCSKSSGLTGRPEVEGTAEFADTFDKYLDILNVSNFDNGKGKEKDSRRHTMMPQIFD